MLTGPPAEIDILQSQADHVSRKALGRRGVARCLGCQFAQEMRVSQKPMDYSTSPVESQEGYTHPDVVASVLRDVDEDQPEEYSGCDDVLGNKDLVAGCSEEAKARKDHPGDYSPCAEAIFDHWHHLKLKLDKVG